MTGPEIVGAAKAAGALGQAGKNALDEDNPVKAKLLELSEDSSAMKSAAESFAKRVAIRQAILTKIYEPLAKLLGIQTDYFDNHFADDLAERIAHIPDEAVVSPPPSLALPAMQGLGWSLDEPDLKEMYLNLLARATDGRRSDQAHPSFADIIKQLSSAEAKYLILCLRKPSKSLPIVNLRAKHSDGSGYNTVLTNLIDSLDGQVRNRFADPSEGVWLDNWARLGLITISYAEHLTATDAYGWVDSRPETVAVKNFLEGERASEEEVGQSLPEGADFPASRARTFDVEKGIIRVTEFGKRFLDAVAVDESQVVSSSESSAESSSDERDPSSELPHP